MDLLNGFKFYYYYVYVCPSSTACKIWKIFNTIIISTTFRLIVHQAYLRERQSLERVIRVRYLGLLIDEKLCFNDHINGLTPLHEKFIFDAWFRQKNRKFCADFKDPFLHFKKYLYCIIRHLINRKRDHFVLFLPYEDHFEDWSGNVEYLKILFHCN